MRLVATLGDAEGDGYVSETLYATRDMLGRYWLGEHDGIKIFAGSGQFVGHFGRRGKGPLEFVDAMPLYRDAKGNVHIFDGANLRRTAIDADLMLVDEARLPGVVHAAAPLSEDGVVYAANMTLNTPAAIGLPLHVIAGDSVRASFGITEDQGRIALNHPSLFRVVATRNGIVHAVPAYDYYVQTWDSAGRALGAWRGPRLDTKPPEPGRWSSENPPPNRIFALRVVQDGQILVVSWMRRHDWLSNMVEDVLPDGRVQYAPRGGSFSSIFTSRLDLVDLATGRVVARIAHDRLFVAFVDDGLLLANTVAPTGTPQVEIWEVRVRASH